MTSEGDRLAALLLAAAEEGKKLRDASRFAARMITDAEFDLLESGAGELKKLSDLLRRLEWSGGDADELPRCPCCGVEKPNGALKEHERGCLLAIAIGAWRRP